MARPHVTIYNQISIDGRIEGFAMDGARYYRRGFRWRSDAILMGSVTAQNFGPAEPPEQRVADMPALEQVPIFPGFEDLVYEPRPLLVVPDSRGSVRNWRHALAQPWYRSILVLVSRRTPSDYLGYLRRRGIDHLAAGDDRVDLAAALDQLATGHGVASIRTDSGGGLNGALLAAGLVDEMVVIVSPRVSGQPESQSLVRLPHAMQPTGVPLRLMELETLADGAVWLRYRLGD